MNKYEPQKIEAKWQKIWDEKKDLYHGEDNSSKPKHYQLIEFPYPSGAGLHVGHCMGYGASDAYSRMKRMQGFNVMFPMGWDAFGLPTENFAIKTGRKPADVTKENSDTFRRQMKSMGFSFDWDREVNTSDPNYYKWTQWIFVQFYKHAVIDNKLIEVADDDTETPRLAYQAEIAINWCPSCKIGLANEEVISGKCERCETEVTKKMQKQWMLRITAYADRLIKDLDTVDYLDKIKTQQVNWIGRSTGTNVKFEIRNPKYETNPKSETQNSKQNIEVYTTRADTLFGCTYIVIAPESGYMDQLKDKISNLIEVEKYIDESKKKSDMERTELAKDKTGVKLEGVTAINPINNEEVEIYVADYVLANYGTGAVMAVPAHDDRDYEFAKKYNINIVQVITNKDNSINIDDKAFCDYGVLVNSKEFDGLSSEEAKKKITEKLKENYAGDFAINYKLRDWIFSRQHYWGEPIPIVYCSHCAQNNRKSEARNPKSETSMNYTIINNNEYMLVPVPEDQLPVKLPDVENYQPTNTGESPLADIKEWVNVKCPKCGGDAKRETDTMPNWAGSSWYFLAYCMQENTSRKLKVESGKDDSNTFIKNKDKLNYWMPVDLYNGGMEHTTLHLLYSRFWNKFLFDLGVAPTSEPYKKRIAHGIILGSDGRKMSKSFGNVISPDDVSKQYGADTTRAYIMFIGPYDAESAWNTAGVAGVSRFLNRVYNNFSKVKDNFTDSKELLIKLNQSIKGITDDIENFRLNTVVSKLMELNNTIEKSNGISKDSYDMFIQLLFPAVPHLASELWEMAGHTEQLDTVKWPEVDKNYLVAEEIEIVVQINGKVRDKIMVAFDISDDDLKSTAMSSEKVKANLEGKEIIKTIVVPKKLVSIVVK